MRRIGLLTSDFGLYHDLVRYLRDRKVAFTSLAFDEELPSHVGVLVTSWRDTLGAHATSDLPVVAVPVDARGNEDVAGAVAQALRILDGVPGYLEVVVGVDPGKRPGVALLGDGRVVHTAQVFDPQDAAPLVGGLLTQFPAQRYVIRLGHGAPQERDRILRALRALDREDVRIELVDETGTTPATGARGRVPPDVAAALRIARTPGPAAPHRRARIGPGQIREIQRESRQFTGGRLTISRDQARRVAQGLATLEEAVADEERAARRGSKSRSSSRAGSTG